MSNGFVLPATYAGDLIIPMMPSPGTKITLSPAFKPSLLQGITIHPDNSLAFDFLIAKGDQDLADDQKSLEYKKLVKYFLASLTTPDSNQWVNLSPYEKDRIIDQGFSQTEMGRDLLAQDYLLKQITSSLMYPEEGLGKKFWARVYERAWNEFHTNQIPVSSINKVWIVPEKAVVYESGQTAYILTSHLKVMLEQDYLAVAKNQSQAGDMFQKEQQNVSSSTLPSEAASTMKAPQGNPPSRNVLPSSLSSQIIKEIIIPELEKEINEGKNFSSLRQIYSGMILATWFKKSLKQSLLAKAYANQEKVQGIGFITTSNDHVGDIKDIYQQYLLAFKKGVYNYIKEDVDRYTQEVIPRKYFSGGLSRNPQDVSIVTSPAMIAGQSELRSAVNEVLKGDFDTAMITLLPDGSFRLLNMGLTEQQQNAIQSAIATIMNDPKERANRQVLNLSGNDSFLDPEKVLQSQGIRIYKLVGLKAKLAKLLGNQVPYDLWSNASLNREDIYLDDSDYEGIKSKAQDDPEWIKEWARSNLKFLSPKIPKEEELIPLRRKIVLPSPPVSPVELLDPKIKTKLEYHAKVKILTSLFILRTHSSRHGYRQDFYKYLLSAISIGEELKPISFVSLFNYFSENFKHTMPAYLTQAIDTLLAKEYKIIQEKLLKFMKEEKKTAKRIYELMKITDQDYNLADLEKALTDEKPILPLWVVEKLYQTLDAPLAKPKLPKTPNTQDQINKQRFILLKDLFVIRKDLSPNLFWNEFYEFMTKVLLEQKMQILTKKTVGAYMYTQSVPIPPKFAELVQTLITLEFKKVAEKLRVIQFHNKKTDEQLYALLIKDQETVEKFSKDDLKIILIKENPDFPLWLVKRISEIFETEYASLKAKQDKELKPKAKEESLFDKLRKDDNPVLNEKLIRLIRNVPANAWKKKSDKEWVVRLLAFFEKKRYFSPRQNQVAIDQLLAYAPFWQEEVIEVPIESEKGVDPKESKVNEGLAQNLSALEQQLEYETDNDKLVRLLRNLSELNKWNDPEDKKQAEEIILNFDTNRNLSAKQRINAIHLLLQHPEIEAVDSLFPDTIKQEPPDVPSIINAPLKATLESTLDQKIQTLKKEIQKYRGNLVLFDDKILVERLRKLLITRAAWKEVTHKKNITDLLDVYKMQQDSFKEPQKNIVIELLVNYYQQTDELAKALIEKERVDLNQKRTTESAFFQNNSLSQDQKSKFSDFLRSSQGIFSKVELREFQRTQSVVNPPSKENDINIEDFVVSLKEELLLLTEWRKIPDSIIALFDEFYMNSGFSQTTKENIAEMIYLIFSEDLFSQDILFRRILLSVMTDLDLESQWGLYDQMFRQFGDRDTFLLEKFIKLLQDQPRYFDYLLKLNLKQMDAYKWSDATKVRIVKLKIFKPQDLLNHISSKLETNFPRILIKTKGSHPEELNFPKGTYKINAHQGKLWQNIRNGVATSRVLHVDKIAFIELISDSAMNTGGIDFTAKNFDLQIKRDGLGVPLPLVQQDMDALKAINGFVPVIIRIVPVTSLPLLHQLQKQIQTLSATPMIH